MGRPVIDKPTYKGIHNRLNLWRGKASAYTCQCGEQAKEWAHIHDTDYSDVDNYNPMCISCHRKYDYRGGCNSIGENNSNAKMTESEVVEIRRLYSEGMSIADIVFVYDSTHNTISKIVHRRTWRHV